MTNFKAKGDYHADTFMVISGFIVFDTLDME